MKTLPSFQSVGSYSVNQLKSDNKVRNCDLLLCQLTLTCYLLTLFFSPPDYINLVIPSSLFQLSLFSVGSFHFSPRHPLIGLLPPVLPTSILLLE